MLRAIRFWEEEIRSTIPENLFSKRLKALFEVAEDGKLVRKSTGKEVGWTAKNGYRLVKVMHKGIKRTFMVHRINWFLTNGTWPEEIDHDDRSRSHNNPTNLRPATRSQNTARRKMPTRPLPRGVVDASHTNKKNPFMAQCGNKYIGYFPTAEAAHEAFKAKHLELYGKAWSYECHHNVQWH